MNPETWLWDPKEDHWGACFGEYVIIATKVKDFKLWKVEFDYIPTDKKYWCMYPALTSNPHLDLNFSYLNK